AARQEGDRRQQRAKSAAPPWHRRHVSAAASMAHAAARGAVPQFHEVDSRDEPAASSLLSCSSVRKSCPSTSVLFPAIGPSASRSMHGKIGSDFPISDDDQQRFARVQARAQRTAREETSSGDSRRAKEEGSGLISRSRAESG